MNSNIDLGNEGETEVINFLINNNFKILEKNYRTKFGEIDIIAQKKETLAFIEVKTRKTKYFPISNVVTFSKQQKIIKTAKLFISKNKIQDKFYRFDVAEVLLQNKKYIINYITNAFQEN